MSNVCACVCVAYVFISYVCTHTRFLFCIIYMCVYICIYKPGVGGEQDFFFVHQYIYVYTYQVLEENRVLEAAFQSYRAESEGHLLTSQRRSDEQRTQIRCELIH